MSRIGAPSARSSRTRCGPVPSRTRPPRPISSTIGPMRRHGVDRSRPSRSRSASFGRLDMERVRGAAPVAGGAARSDPRRTPRIRPSTSPGSTRPKYSPWGNATRLPANRSPPTCVLSQVMSQTHGGGRFREGSPTLRAAGSRRPCVQTDEEWLALPGRRRHRGRADPGGARPRSGRLREARARRRSVSTAKHMTDHRRTRRRSRLADQQDARAGSAFERPEVPPEPGRQSGVEEPVAPPWAGMLDQQPMADRRCRAGEGFLDGQAPQRAPIPDRGHGCSGAAADREQPFADQPAHQDRAAGRVGEIGRQLADRELGELVQVRDPTHRRFHPRRHLEPPVPEEHDEAIGPRSRSRRRRPGAARPRWRRPPRSAPRAPRSSHVPAAPGSRGIARGARRPPSGRRPRRAPRRAPRAAPEGRRRTPRRRRSIRRPRARRSPRSPARRRRSAPRARASRGRRR